MNEDSFLNSLEGDRAKEGQIDGQRFQSMVGVVTEVSGPGEAVSTLEITDAVSQGISGSVHGGVIATMIDEAGSLAAATLISAVDLRGTAELQVSYLRPAKGKIVKAFGKVIKAGRNLTYAQVEVRVYDDVLDNNNPRCGDGLLVATGKVLYASRCTGGYASNDENHGSQPFLLSQL